MSVAHKEQRNVTGMALGLVMAVGVGAAAPMSADAALVSSDEFSFGYGYDPVPGSSPTTYQWIPVTSANTPTTQGDFTLTVDVTSGLWSAAGPTFPNRVLTSGGEGSGSGNSATFTATITAEYNGPTLPGLETRLEINSIRIWAFGDGAPAGTTIRWLEVTPGNEGTSNDLVFGSSGAGGGPRSNAANYSQLLWSPDDLTLSGTTVTRSFNLESAAGRPIDGFEVFATVHAIPEPASLGLLGLGSLLMLSRRRRQA
ncbi:PEP-CTERM sorting domain-containing protein [Phycisphaerales bacterium AB-hyl4]|uniref:PEP-CTERM sorting domain-containing protein n=1 Tax=Natronomicrosphaera hydrolytica TaxID=3242702 RepID=A0ABV4U9L0_9BACT